MPVCPQCDNRPFANKEALMQHIRSSSAFHPFCGACDRRFTSSNAFEAHMSAKHPPTYDCTLCDRKYHAKYALEDHYRGSSAHPNCSACGQGFFDTVARDEHECEIRVPVTIEPIPPLPQHEDALQLSPEETKSICDLVDSGIADPLVLSTPATAPMLASHLSSTGFTPLSTHNHAQRLVLGNTARDRDTFYSPDLRLDTHPQFSSPILDTKPIFSTSSSYLPRPGTGIEAIWSSRDNISTPTHTPSLPPRRSQFSSPLPPPLPRLSGLQSVLAPTFVSRFNTHPRTFRGGSSYNAQDFDQRLYPGSQRQRARLELDTSSPTSLVGSRTGGYMVPQPGRIITGVSGTSTPKRPGSAAGSDDEFSSPLLDLRTPVAATRRPDAIGEVSPSTVSTSPESSLGFSMGSPSSLAHEPDSRPTTANSSNGMKWIVTASSDTCSPVSCSPTVDSPEGLGVLPGVSPLSANTVVEIEEAKCPLPESTPASPLTTVDALVPPPSRLDTAISPISSTQSPNIIKTSPTCIRSPKSPLPRSTNPNPLHCRACLADSCDDITASMCGHIFCNRCITDAVIKTSRCPLCMTPTLLYCLFRLDLGA